eukprot:862183-Prymnesium_polylepis.1
MAGAPAAARRVETLHVGSARPLQPKGGRRRPPRRRGPMPPRAAQLGRVRAPPERLWAPAGRPCVGGGLACVAAPHAAAGGACEGRGGAPAEAGGGACAANQGGGVAVLPLRLEPGPTWAHWGGPLPRW